MKYGLIGEYLSHSFSKEIHEKIAGYSYEICEIPKNMLDEFMQKREFAAINVTIPYKRDVIKHLDFVSDTAKKIGAVNTIVNKNGKLYGYNTDFYGMSSLMQKFKINPQGKNVLICGTGGTSQTAQAVMQSMGAKSIAVVSRTKSANTLTYGEVYKTADSFEIIVNTTPVGMFPNTDAECVDAFKFKNLEGAIDAVYNPQSTLFVQKAQKCGAAASGGLYMLVAQAVKAAELFLDKKLGEDIYDIAYDAILREKQNLVLTGMPGCGKTTVGGLVAQQLGRKFYDTDEEIYKKTSRRPAEIIKKSGEEVFRKTETEIIKTLSDKTGIVIATGGGAVLKSENIINLKKNGKIYFLDRDISHIVPTADRPLTCDRERLEKIYGERYSVYINTADRIVEAKSSAQETADIVRSEFE